MFTLALCINASSLANKSYFLIFSDSTVCSISCLVTPTSIRVISPFFFLVVSYKESNLFKTIYLITLGVQKVVLLTNRFI